MRKGKNDLPRFTWEPVGDGYKTQQFTGMMDPTFHQGGEHMVPYPVVIDVSIVPVMTGRNNEIRTYLPRVTMTPGRYAGESISHWMGGKRRSVTAAKTEARQVFGRIVQVFLGFTLDEVQK